MSKNEKKRVSGGKAFQEGMGNPTQPLIEITEDGPATSRQVNFLVKVGGMQRSQAVALTKTAASRKIDRLKRQM